MIPYGRQTIDEEDIRSVEAALRSDWLTTGPLVPAFEQAVASFCNARHGVAVANGTAALHACMHAAGVGPGDEVIVPAMTFAASANCVLYQGGTPVFVDVDPDTLLVAPQQVEEKITLRTRAIIAVDYGGQPCDYDGLRALADRHGLYLIDDACHSLGASYKGRKIGELADLTVFSFHPVKHITTGEGGMIVTNDQELAERIRRFRNHGITSDHRSRAEQGTWYYEMTELGYNYRLTDLQAALGISQLKKLPAWLDRRREIAAAYDRALAPVARIRPLARGTDREHAYHLYAVRIEGKAQGTDRDAVFRFLRQAGIGCNVHYVPVHLHPYYRKRFGLGPGLCPVAEQASKEILSLPMFPGLAGPEIDFVIDRLQEALSGSIAT